MRNLVVLLGFILAGGCSAAELKPDAPDIVSRGETKIDVFLRQSNWDTAATNCRGTIDLHNTWQPGNHLFQQGRITLRCGRVQYTMHPGVSYEPGSVQVIINGNYASTDCRLIDMLSPFGDLNVWLDCG